MSRWVKISPLAALSAMVVCGALGGCPQPAQPTSAALDITVSPRSQTDDGATVDVTVNATEASGSSGTGQVSFTADVGTLDGKGLQETFDLANGKASAKWGCSGPTCKGAQHITATWKDQTAVGTVTFIVVGLDASEPGLDASVVGLDAAQPGLDASIQLSDYKLSLTPDEPNIYGRVGASTGIVAQLTWPDGGGIANQAISISTNRGGLFVAPDGGMPGTVASLSLTTDQSGKAAVRFTDVDPTGNPAIAGTAKLDALHSSSGATATTNVEILGVNAVVYKGMTCNGNACTMLGLKGSGWNEKGDLAFQVLNNSTPAAGVLVTFAFSNGDVPPGTTITPSATTNASGIAICSASSGISTGVFTVVATAVPGANPVQGYSTPIGVRGAKASNKNFMFACDTVNLAVYVSNNPPAAYTVNCTVRLYDRFNNPVGTGAQVYFKTEAGGITNSITTKAFDPTPGADNSSEGMGSVTFATNGSFPPIDVAPLPADNNQWPYHRAAEPSISPAGTLVFNPRDGLVTILAYTTGEEFYTDKDPVTGAWTFIDQSKPFVDTDDNDTFNGADICPTGTWAPANGVWDKDTTVWTETHILYTDRPKPDPQYSYIVPNPFPSVAKGTTQTLDFFFGDLNLNRSISAGTTFAATHTATKGSVTIPNPSILDGYGFSIEKMLVDAATEQNCVIGTTPICKWKWLFGTWGRGYSGSVVITGAPTSDVAPPSPDVVSVDSTVLGQKITTQATGTIQ